MIIGVEEHFEVELRIGKKGVVSLDVTPFIQTLYASVDDFAGFNFQFAVPTNIEMNGPFVGFNSLEFPPAAKLNLTIIPAPGAVMLASMSIIQRHIVPKSPAPTDRKASELTSRVNSGDEKTVPL